MDQLNWYGLFERLSSERLVPLWPDLDVPSAFVERPAPLIRSAQRYGYGYWLWYPNRPPYWEGTGEAPDVERQRGHPDRYYAGLLEAVLGEMAREYGAAPVADFRRWAWLLASDGEQRPALLHGSWTFGPVAHWGEVRDPHGQLGPALSAMVVESARRHFGPAADAALAARLAQALATPPSVFERDMYRTLAHQSDNSSMAENWASCRLLTEAGVKAYTRNCRVLRLWRDLRDRLSLGEWERVIQWARAGEQTGSPARSELVVPALD